MVRRVIQALSIVDDSGPATRAIRLSADAGQWNSIEIRNRSYGLPKDFSFQQFFRSLKNYICICIDLFVSCSCVNLVIAYHILRCIDRNEVSDLKKKKKACKKYHVKM